MAKRQTIGENPLDSLIQPVATAAHNGHPTLFLEVDEKASKKKPRQVKQRITVQISVDVIERVKNAVYWTPGLTLASLAEEALSEAVDEIEKARGEPFPTRKEELKTGRPLS